MSKQTIIGVGYKKSRGKDTFAKFMVNWLKTNYPELKVQCVGFADKLKDISYQLFKWAGLQPGIYYESNYHEKEVVLPAINLSPRKIWIGMGNKVREIYADTWSDFVLRGGITADVILVKDMGFLNEATKIEDCGGYLVRMDREGEMATDNRETELDAWTRWSFTVSNNGTLRELNDKTVWICEQIFGGPKS